jgi:hypothetical protein
MPRQNFVDRQSPVIGAAWLNSLDVAVLEAIGNGTSMPTTPAEVVENLGLSNLSPSGDFIQAGTGAVTRTMQNKARDIVSLWDFDDVDPTGATSSQAGVLAAITYCRENSHTLMVPAGKYLITGGIQLYNIKIVGEGASDQETPYTSDGTQFWQTDTTMPMFYLHTDVTIENLTFYYPNQTGLVETPITYEPTFSTETGVHCSNVNFFNCYWINAFRAINIRGTAIIAHGRIIIDNCRGFAYHRFLELEWILDLVQVSNFTVSVGMWQDIAITGDKWPWKYSSTYGKAFDVAGRVDGIWLDGGIVFGYAVGLEHSSTSGATTDWTQVRGVLFDRCPFGIRLTVDHGRLGGMVISACQFYCADAFNTVTNTYSIVASGAQDVGDITISGCSFVYSSGNHIVFGGADSIDSLTITGNTFQYWGQAAALTADRYGLLLETADGDVVFSGNTFLGGDPYAVGVTVTSCSTAVISNNAFYACRIGVEVAGPGTYVVTGNTSRNSTFRGFVAASYTNLIHNNNAFDTSDHRQSKQITFTFASTIGGLTTLSAIGTLEGVQEYDVMSVGMPYTGPHTVNGVQFWASPAAANAVRLFAYNPNAGSVSLGNITCRIGVVPRDMV